MELLVILGLMLALITPAIFFAYTKSVEASQGFAYTKASETLERISTLVEMVASSGEGSAVRAKVEIPSGALLKAEAVGEGSILSISVGDTVVVKTLPYAVVLGPPGAAQEGLKGGIYTLVVENKGSFIEVRVEG